MTGIHYGKSLRLRERVWAERNVSGYDVIEQAGLGGGLGGRAWRTQSDTRAHRCSCVSVCVRESVCVFVT